MTGRTKGWRGGRRVWRKWLAWKDAWKKNSVRRIDIVCVYPYSLPKSSIHKCLQTKGKTRCFIIHVSYWLSRKKSLSKRELIYIYHWLCVVYICCMVCSFSEKSSVCTRTRTRKPLAFIYVCTSEDGSMWILQARPSKCSYKLGQVNVPISSYGAIK